METTSISALSSKDLVSKPFPSVFHISYKPPASSPSDLAGGPSIETTDFPSSFVGDYSSHIAS